MGGPKSQKHGCKLGIVRIPGRGWPVVCETCGRIGFGFDRKEGRRMGSQHSRNTK